MKFLAALLFGFAFPAAAAPSADNGAALFTDHCAACHDHPTGRIPPHYALSHLGPDQVYRALRTGPMRPQATGLSEADLGALVFFLTHQAVGAAGSDPAANPCAKPGGPIDLNDGARRGYRMAGCGYFLADFFALRVFLPPFAFDAAAPAIRKSSAFLPDLIAAASQRGFNPRPAQVSAGFSGLRYLGATAPRAPNPRATFDADLPP